MSIRDLLASLVRTIVPTGVGAVLAWLASRAGIVLDESSSTGLVVGVTGLASAIYYAAVRLAESKWRWAGVLLGWKVPPSYDKPAVNNIHYRQVNR